MLAEVSASAYAKLVGPDGLAREQIALDPSESATNRGFAHSQGWFAVFLILSWVQFSGAWLYPPAVFGTIDPTGGKAFGVPFQYVMWLLVVTTALYCFRARGVLYLVGPLKPLLPFLLVGLVSGLFGFSPVESLRRIGFWLLMAIAAVSVGEMLGPALIEKCVRRAMTAILVGSILVVLVLPDFGKHVPGGEWRGLFPAKNALGWIGLLGLACALGLPNGRESVFLALVAVVVLLGSASKGALAVGILLIGYLVSLRAIRGRLSVGLGTIVLLVGAALAGAVAMFAMPTLLSLLGRDATLTGRTDIWQTYFEAMLPTPVIGQGPGAFTGASPMTLALAYRLSSFGSILTPHNMLLGAFGDAGIIGVLTLALPLLWLTVWLPLSTPSRWTTACAAIGFAVLGHGTVETHEVYGAGPGMFLLLLAYTAYRRQHLKGVTALSHQTGGAAAELFSRPA